MQANQSLASVQSVSELIFSLRMQIYTSTAAAYGIISLIEDDELSETLSAGLKHSLHETELLLDALEIECGEQWE